MLVKASRVVVPSDYMCSVGDLSLNTFDSITL